MKIFLTLLLNMLFILPAGAEVLSIGISQNEISDINNYENQSMLLKGITDLKDRTLAKFSDGSYGIIYKAEPNFVLYYSSGGILTHKEVKTSLEYPYKTYKYKINGQLENMTYRVSEGETYIYSPNGKLLAHWVGNYCYDKAGSLIMTRQIEK